MKRRTVILVPAIALLVGAMVMLATMTPSTTDALRAVTHTDRETVQAPDRHRDQPPAVRADLDAIAAGLRQRESEQDPSAAEPSMAQARRLIETADAALSKLPPGSTQQVVPAAPVEPKPVHDLASRIAALREQLDGLQR